MAANPQTLTTYNSILKERYLPKFIKTFNEETVLLNRLRRKAPTEVSGREYRFPLHTARNFGGGFRPELGTPASESESVGPAWSYSTTPPYLPEAGHQGLTVGVLTRSHCYYKFMVTGASMDAGKRDGAALDEIDIEMTGIRKDMAKYINKSLYGTGSGHLAIDQASGAQTATTITVDTSMYLEVGMPIVLASSTGTSAMATTDAGGALTISAISGTSVTLSGETTYTGGDYIYPAGVYDTNLSAVYGQACDGLGNIVTNSTYADRDYAGIDRTNYHYADSTMIDGSSGLDPDLMFQAIHGMRNAAGGKCSLILCDFTQWRNYGDTFHGARNWEGNVKKLDGGFDSLSFNGIPVVPDVDCPAGMMYFLDESQWAILQEKPIGFAEPYGQVLQWLGVGANSVDAYEACLIYRFAVACFNPKGQAALYSLPTS